MSDNTVEGRAARRRRDVKRLALGTVFVLVFVLIVGACQGHQPYIASDAVAAQQDHRTVAALNAFMEPNGGLSQWKDYYDEGESRPEPFRELTGDSVCSNTDILGFTTGDAGRRREVNLSSTSEVTARKVLDNAERVWAEYDITRRGDNRGRSSWTQVRYSGGRSSPTFYVSYSGANPDAKVNMLILAASVCREL
ncbi:hypothetical protein [Curtobacterium sp. VKM Ac-1376]|uniref:hypothetical protein n=1 Tax=Curtobacterium sp. VKM Ac-1376 TaxID=123312 RepID=UPI00188C76E5|nr:hypothetical protein [Curtobacterium sp. VKM Ac-1376]MBF4613877.1 hypothetical protein [Curtobacterium sp. VKM Ac-1376]